MSHIINFKLQFLPDSREINYNEIKIKWKDERES